MSTGQNRDESGVSASSIKRERPGLVDAELELRVRDDDAARQRVLGGEAVERDRRVAHLRRDVAADQRRDVRQADVLVVLPALGLGRGVKIGSGRRSASRSPRGSAMPHTAPVR